MITSITQVALLVLSIVAGPARSSVSPAPTPPEVVVARLDEAIGPATRDYIRRALAVAAERNATCAVIVIDTPGGLSASMRDIIKDILASPVPVVVYVAPSGARAASAGALIALAAHVAVMAPGTNIGAAHPVSIGGGGETSDTMEEKITNDAAAYARSLATQRNRNVAWAERVVRESISSTAEEAVRDSVADFIADNMDSLLVQLDGRVLETAAGTVTLATRGATLVEVTRTARERFLARISDPNIAYLLMIAGIFGVIFELQNPGAIFPGVIGVIALITSAFALQMLPVSFTGLALIALAVVLFILEIKVTSHGALAIGGVISMVLGSVMLIDSPLPFMRVSLSVIIPTVLATAAFFLVVVGLGVRAQRRRVITGSAGLVGSAGVARTDIHASGTVFVHGELWNAHSDAPIPRGAEIRVIEVNGLKLKIEAA